MPPFFELAQTGARLRPFTEFRNHTNGLSTIAGNGLLGALVHYGIDGIGATEKKDMRDLVLRGGPWTSDEQIAILDYCESDVAALARSLPAMLPRIDLPRAIYRGRYMAAVASMEYTGIPMGVANFDRLRDRWISISDQLIVKIDSDYRVYEGRTFKTDRFERWLIQHEIPWPVLDSGRLALDDDTFPDTKIKSNQRAEILRMVNSGKTSAAEAARLFGLHRR